MKKQNILLDFIIHHKYSYIIGIICMLVASYIQTLFPMVLGKTIDILTVSGFDRKRVILNIFYIMLISIGTFLTTYAWRNLVIRNARELECHIRELLFNHFQIMSPNFYNNRKTGDLIAYAINDINAVRQTFGPAIAMSINGIAICAASIYAMIYAIDWRLTLMCLLPIPFIVALMMRLGKIIQRRFKIVQESFAAISDRVQENIYGIRVIKAYVQEEDEVVNFGKLNSNMYDSNLDMVKISSILAPMIELCFSISFVLNLIIGGNMVLNGTISLGDFIAFNTYLTLIMAPVIQIGQIINVFHRGMASYKRLIDIFSVESEINYGEKRLNIPINGNIECKNLSFTYPGSQDMALKNITLHIPKGHTLGIIGRTGSGKTTIASLFLKLYNIDRDEIFLDGKDIDDFTLNALRNGFGYVPQDNFLFSSSIKENIRFFKEAYSLEQVEDAAKASCIYDSIMDLPKGFETILGERGVNLSGGQKQRISIARAVVKDPAVLILDDALSAVDTITEAEILRNLRHLRENKTTIIIAHKISSVKDADEIIVLDEGEICEKGTHSELVRKGGQYYEIFKEQSKDRQSAFSQTI